MKKLFLLAIAFCFAAFSASAQACADLSVSIAKSTGTTYKITIKNIGTAKAPASKGNYNIWNIKLNKQASRETFSVPELSAGQTFTKNVTMIALCTLTANADSNETIDECKEDNNNSNLASN